MVDNVLYYGDNLDVMRDHIADASVDLEYLDPPFNSNAVYNVLFKETNGTKAQAQMKAFEDTWTWDEKAARAYQETVERGGPVSRALQAFHGLLGNNNLMAYLAMMAPRLVELHRVLKPTGSIYLHCDPTASHYLKVVMDAIFKPENFRNEIIWKRTSAHNDPNRYGSVHDVLLFYTKSSHYVWNTIYAPYDPAYLEMFLDSVDEQGKRYKRADLTGAGVTQGPSGRPWRGIDVASKGRHWAYVPSALDELDAKGRIHWPRKEGGMPRLKQYGEDLPGVPAQDVWTDIRTMHNLSAERLGYPTQKPEALLERIIAASCPENGVVLDPFAGCGTSVVAAQRSGRAWIGIDITYAAIGLIRKRLKDSFGEDVRYTVVGEPTTVADAFALFNQDPYQFQWWALVRVGAGKTEQKRGADKGIDGRLYFFDDPTGKTKQIIFSVKGGKVDVGDIRDLRGVIDRESAEIGVLITLRGPTRDMRTEALSAGYYTSPWNNQDHPRIQILTIKELLEGKKIDYNPAQGANVTFQKAPKAKKQAGKQQEMDL